MTLFGECTICLEEIKDLAHLDVLTTCGHTFHGQCIRDWIKNKAECPSCREACTGVHVRRLYFNGLSDDAKKPSASAAAAHKAAATKNAADVAAATKNAADLAAANTARDVQQLRAENMELDLNDLRQMHEITVYEIEAANVRIAERDTQLEANQMALVESMTRADAMEAQVARLTMEVADGKTKMARMQPAAAPAENKAPPKRVLQDANAGGGGGGPAPVPKVARA